MKKEEEEEREREREQEGEKEQDIIAHLWCTLLEKVDGFPTDIHVTR